MSKHLSTLREAKSSTSGVLQRQCACGNHTHGGGECEACKQKKAALQRSARDDSTHDEVVPQSVYDTLRTPGQPLDEDTRGFMERRFGHDLSALTTVPHSGVSGLTIDPANSPSEAAADRNADGLFSDQRSAHRFDFSGVRLHTDAQAAESARAVNARAYTVGSDVVFGAGQFSPHTRPGQWLLGHELTHVVQQQSAPAVSLQRVGFFESVARFFGGGTFSDIELKNYVEFLRTQNRIEDSYDSDNKAREVVQRWKQGKADFLILSIPIRILLIKEMISGFTGNEDEQAILDLMSDARPTELQSMVNGVGEALLRSNFHGNESKQLDGLLGKSKGTAVIPTDDLQSPRFSKLKDLEDVFDGAKVLDVGSKGRSVQAIQQALYDLGFTQPTFGADGDFGGETKAAVKAFQLANPPLVDSGKVDKATMVALDARFAAPVLPAKGALSGPWNSACVLSILCPWSPHTVEVLNTSITLKSFDDIYWEDEMWNGASWEISKFPGGGYQDRAANEIGVLNSSCESMAETLYHEVLHAEQPTKHTTTREKEGYAYRIGEEFSIDMGLGGRSGLRSTDAQGREFADRAKVESFVAAEYPGVSSAAPGDQIIAKAAALGHVLVERPDGSRFTRPAAVGEKVPGPIKLDGEKTEPTTTWTCP